MDNINYAAFIDKVINMTKEHALSWAYLDTEEALCKGMNWMATSRETSFLALTDILVAKHFDEENSFVCCRDDTYIVLFVGARNSLPTLYVIPYTYKGSVVLKPEEYGEYTTRLHNLVKRQFPHADNFIADFLAEQ